MYLRIYSSLSHITVRNMFNTDYLSTIIQEFHATCAGAFPDVVIPAVTDINKAMYPYGMTTFIPIIIVVSLIILYI
nr:hypothetical protein PBILCG01_0041600 [Plasmodium sp. DRC-Itaito]